MSEIKKLKLSHPWVASHHFSVTRSLLSLQHTIPDRDRWKYSFVQSLILQQSAQFEKHWVDVPTTRWKNRFGRNYHEVTAALEKLGQLEVNRRSQWTKNKSGQTYSYCIPKQALDSGITNIVIPKKRVKSIEDTSQPTDQVSEHALASLRSLRVRQELIFPPPQDKDQDPVVRKGLILTHCEHLLFGDFGLRYGKNVKRLYHRLLAMPREGRVNMMADTPMTEYDVKTCHPFLLLTFFSDRQEREKYAEMLEWDIYTQIHEEMGLSGRPEAKIDFQRVVNMRWKEANYMANEPVVQFFYKHFPKFTGEVLYLRNDLAPALQSLEARLLIKELGNECVRKDLQWIPMHDGFISATHQGEEIKSIAVAILKKHIGFTPHLSSSPIFQPNFLPLFP